MIYLVFTQTGFEQAQQSVIDNKATLWINPSVLSESQLAELSNAGIMVKLQEQPVDPANDKAIFIIIDIIEKECPNTELFVELI